MTRILAEANAREMMSLTALCLVIRLGAILHTKAWRPYVSTCDPHRQVCAAQRPRPSRKATATRTASSSRRRPHEAIGSANSQSPLDVWRLRLRKLLFASGLCCFRKSNRQPGGPACPRPTVYETSRPLEQYCYIGGDSDWRSLHDCVETTRCYVLQLSFSDNVH